MPLNPKFISNLENEISGQGLFQDLTTSVSKSIEMTDKGCTFSEAFIKKCYTQLSLYDFYNYKPNNHIIQCGGININHPLMDLL